MRNGHTFHGLVVVNTNTVTLVGAPRRATQGTAGGPIPEAVLASQPKRSAVRRAAPSRRDRAILVLASRRSPKGSKAASGIGPLSVALSSAKISPANVIVFTFTTT